MIKNIECHDQNCDWPTCNGCSLQKYSVFICDKCKEEVDELWEYQGMELCQSCVLQQLDADKVIEIDPDDFGATYEDKYYEFEHEVLEALENDGIIRKVEE